MKKVAVPVRGNFVEEHFGHCETFTVFQIDENNAIAGKEIIQSGHECGCRSNIAMELASRGVSVMLAGGLGQGARNVLNQAGIEVYSGFSGQADSVVQRFLNGDTGDNSSCAGHQHHSHDSHGHSCHHHS